MDDRALIFRAPSAFGPTFEGEFLTLLGPSGCGKTTTLRLIAGFIAPSEGQIFLGDAEITHLAPQDRNVGMVFQDYALFPHMTVAENIAFGLTERRVDRQTVDAREEENPSETEGRATGSNIQPPN